MTTSEITSNWSIATLLSAALHGKLVGTASSRESTEFMRECVRPHSKRSLRQCSSRESFPTLWLRAIVAWSLLACSVGAEEDASAFSDANNRLHDVLRQEFAPDERISDPDIRFGVGAAHMAHAQVRAAPSVGEQPTPHQLVDVCLRAYRLRSERKEAEAFRMLMGFSQTAEATRDVEVDWEEIGLILQTALDESNQADLAELEKAHIPEVVKTAKRQRIRLRGDPYRPRRKRLVLDAVCDAGGTVIEDDADVVAAIVAERNPIPLLECRAG